MLGDAFHNTALEMYVQTDFNVPSSNSRKVEETTILTYHCSTDCNIQSYRMKLKYPNTI